MAGNARNKAALQAQEAKRQKLLIETLRFIMSEEKARALCDNLLSSMGSFDGIFVAPEKALLEIPGMDANTARFLAHVVELAQAYLEERAWNLQRVYDTPSAADLFRPKFLGRKTEAVCLMLLDGRGRMVYNDIVCEGSFSEAPLHLRKILQLCIEYRVDAVYLAHNHPSGTALPSAGDMIATDRLLTALSSIDTELCDHVIFAGESLYSFRSSGLLRRQTDIVRQSQIEELNEVRRLGARVEEQ